jgi:hypothetical protein
MLWSTKYLWDTLKGVVHVYWVVQGMNDTSLIAWTKIIEPIMFAYYPNEGIYFLLGFNITM